METIQIKNKKTNGRAQAQHLLDDLGCAVALAKADFVLADRLGGTFGVAQKRRTLDGLMMLREKLLQAAMALGREIYPVETPTIKPARPERRGRYAGRSSALAFCTPHDGYKTPARGLNEQTRKYGELAD